MKNKSFSKKMKHLAIILLVMVPEVSLAEVLGSEEPSNSGAQGGGTFTGNAPRSPQSMVSASQAPNAVARQSAQLSGTGKIAGNANAVNSILNPTSKAEKAAQAAAVFQIPEPQDNSIVRDIVMDISINAFPDKCACPYSRNDDGYECGVESAYYKPGGYRIYCYPQDVRGQQLIFYRKTH